MNRSVVRRTVQPIVGEPMWQRIRAVQRDLQDRRKRHANVRVKVRAAKKRFREDELLAQARVVQADRAADELQQHAGDLTWLARHFKTDKWGGHRYTPHYQHHLAPLRDKPINLLEIGIGGYSRAGAGGASLRMWKHFFPHGQIYGLDIEDKSFVEEPRIRAFQGSQADPDLLARIVKEIGTVDVVVDDGSHRPEHIIATFGILFPMLADDGIYVVEDTQTSYWPEWGGAEDPAAPNTSMALLKGLADGLNYEEFVDESYEPTYSDRHVVGVHFYHNLAFIEKGRNEEGTRKRAILKKRYAAPAS